MDDLSGQAADVGFAARLLALLDTAYETAENPDRFDDLFTEADRFFFPRSAMDGVASDLADVSPRLDGHIARLQGLIDRAEQHVAGGQRVSGGSHLASLVIAEDGSRIVGNAVAARLLGCRFPTRLAMLDLGPAGQAALRKCLGDLQLGHVEGSVIITVAHPATGKPLLAKCTRLQSRDADGTVRRGLSVVINHVDWQDDALAYATRTFGLTPAETDLFSCLLDGLSYPAAADRLGKSRETLRAQGKAILRKAGVANMADLTHLMLGYAYLAEPAGRGMKPVARPRGTPGPHDMIRAADGRAIEVNRYGLPGGRPLLFFHGLYQGPFVTDALHADLHARGYDLIAPSRPGFARTDPPLDWAAFNRTVTDDVLAVCDHYGLTRMDFVVHQAGISFACRAAEALAGRVDAAVMIAAGVPIRDDMLKTMNLEARVAGAAVRYAPKFLDMLLRLGIAKWRRQGAHAYLANLFPAGTPDRATLEDPRTGPVMERGVLHMISQGAQTIVSDGMSAMSDWEPLYRHLPARQLWLHGAHDPVMNHVFVREFLAAQGREPPVVYPDRGGDVLLGAAADVVARLHAFLRA